MTWKLTDEYYTIQELRENWIKKNAMQRNMRHSQVHKDMHNGSTIRKGEKESEKLL